MLLVAQETRYAGDQAAFCTADLRAPAGSGMARAAGRATVRSERPEGRVRETMMATKQRDPGGASGAERKVRSVLLGFTDPDTGEQVVVDLRGSTGFLKGIERQGFVVLRDGGAASDDGAAPLGRSATPGRRTGA